jgi:hypothetical protein
MASSHEAIMMVLPASTHGVEPHRFGIRSTIFSANTNQTSSACTQKNSTDDVRTICKERSQCNKFSGLRPLLDFLLHIFLNRSGAGMIVAAFPLAQLLFSPMIG